jgi:hypothetical protein
VNVATLEKEIELLPAHLQDRLAAFLTALRLHRSGLDQEIFSRLDDHKSENWQSWKDVKSELSGNDLAEE